MGLLVTLAVYGAVWALQKAVAYFDDDDPKPDDPESKQVPTVKSGTVVPLVYGGVTIDDPGVVYASLPTFIKDDNMGAPTWAQTVMLILGIPAQVSSDSTPTNQLLTIFLNGKAIPTDVWARGPRLPQPYSHGTDVAIAVPQFYGPKGQGGNISGFITFENGVDANTDLGFNEVTAEMGADAATLWPKYKRQIKLLFWHQQPGGFRFGENQGLPQISCRVQMHGNCPPDVIEDLITSTWGRAALPAGQIDTASFNAARAILRDEGHFYDNVISNPQDVRTIIQEILSQIDGVLYIEPTTGKFVLKLIRDDYDPDTLLTLDPGNILKDGFVSYEIATWSGGYNQVRIEITAESRQAGEPLIPQDVVVFTQDMAAISGMAQNRVRSVTVRHPGLRNRRIAAIVAARTLQELSSPLATIRLKCNRDAATLRPGMLFKLAWPEYGISGQVFRVQDVDLGTLDDRSVTLYSIRDKFDVDAPLMDVDLGVPEPPPLVLPLEERVVTEAPRMFAVLAGRTTITPGPGAFGTDDLADVYSRGFYLARPAQTTSVGYSARGFDSTFTRDGIDTVEEVPYPTTATLAAAYAYSTNVYDTTVHITVNATAAVAANFFTATAAQIRSFAKNLIMIDGEFLAYESATDLGANVWRLNNIWRGLIDTVPASHDVDATVWFLSDAVGFAADGYVGGRFTMESFTPVNVQLLPRNAGELLSVGAAGLETDVFDPPRLRSRLLYPPADFQVNGVKTQDLPEDGVQMTWRWRERTTMKIVRGDAASEALSVDRAENQVIVQKAPGFTARGPEWLLQAVDSSTEITSLLNTSIAGTGQLAILGRTVYPVNEERAWQDAELLVNAYPWRNLVVNPRFDYSAQGWTIVDGVVLYPADSDRHGGANHYLRSVTDGTGHPNVEAVQTIRLDGYAAANMRAVLEFYEKGMSGDVDDPDELTVTLELYDISNVMIDSLSYSGFTPSTNWTRQIRDILQVDPDTVYMKVRVQMVAQEEDFPEPNLAITDFRLRVGQFFDEMISNGSFEGASFVNWTTAAGNFTAENLGSGAYSGDYVARGGTSATNEIWTEATVFPGWTANTTCLLDLARMNDTGDVGDTGQVILEARSSGGAVLASASTADESITPTGVWARRQLALLLPLTTDHMRVRLIAKRTAGSGTVNTCFDDLRMRVHKNLEVDEWRNADFREPNGQRLPLDLTEWPEAFINGAVTPVPMPDYGFWDGADLRGEIGVEPTLEYTVGQLRLAKFIGCWDPERRSALTTAFEFNAADDGLFAGSADFNYGGFRTEDSFTMVCMIRRRTRANVASGVAGRLDGTAGWSLQIDSSGRIQAFVRGDGGTATATRATSLSDGAPHLVAIIYNGLTQVLTVVDEFGTSTASTATVGNIVSPALPPFRLGKAAAAQSCMEGQIGRAWIWRSALTTGQVQALWTHGRLPGSLALGTYTAPGPVAAFAGEDADGEYWGVFGSAQVPVHTRQFLATEIFGVPMIPTINNLSQNGDLSDTATWTREIVGVTDGFMSPTGFFDALRITGDSTGGVRMAVTTASATAVKLVWFARADVAGTARVVIENASLVNKGTHDYSITTTWTRYEHTFTGWDFSTAIARLRWLSSTTGSAHTTYLAGPVIITQSTAETLIALPYNVGSSPASSIMIPVVGLTPAFNHEGEVGLIVYPPDSTLATRDIVTVDNSSNNNDKRVLTTAGRFSHYDGAATAVNSDVAVVWDDPQAVNARWNLAGLLDETTTVYAGVYFGGVAPTYGRTTAWTPSSTVAMNRITLGGSNLLIMRVVLMSREGPKGASIPESP